MEDKCGWCGEVGAELVAKDDEGRLVCDHCAEKYEGNC